MTGGRGGPHRWVWLGAAAVAAVFLAHALHLAGIAEDAFITFRFARHLVEGHGLVWNVGEAPVEGYTNFSWLLLVAGALALGLDPGVAAQAAGLFASGVTLVYTYRCGVVLCGWGPAGALLPCAVLAVAGPFAAWAVAGLETNFFGACLVVAVFHFARHWQCPRAGDLFACFAALLLAMLTRPEGWFVAPLLLAWAAFLGRDPPRERLAPFVLPAGLALALFAVYFAWRWGTFGQPLPNTFYAKTGGGLRQWVRGARYAGYFLLHYSLPWTPLLALSLRAPAARLLPWLAADRLRARALSGTCAVLLAVWTAYVVWVGGDYMAMYRFFAPVLPLAALLLGAAFERARAAPGARRPLVAAALAIGLAGTLFHSTPLEARLLPPPPGMHGNWRGVQTERWHVARLSAIGRFFRGYARPGESLGTDAIGAISWYSDLPVVGKHGLVDPAVARSADARLGRGWAGHDRGSWAAVLARRPTFVVFQRTLHARRPRRGLRPADVPPALAAEYASVPVWLEDPGNGEAGWLVFLERRDRRDGPRASVPERSQ